jgi:hypothetical protein
MRIGRKEAILALVATMIPWVGRRANAQITRVPLKEPISVRSLAPQAPDVADLQRRIAALEAQLASQVAFTKDSLGNLSLRGNRDINIDAGAGFGVRAGSNLSLRAGGTADVWGSAATTIKGATIALN